MVETYTIRGHGSMLSDPIRMDAYEAALRTAVRPGAVVLDIGTGTGLMALLACRFGARRVYAVEPGDSIGLARAAAKAAGFADRIDFIQGLSTEITLPERADVVVSDLRGILPLFQRHLPAVVDARERLLAPGGVMVGQADTIRLAPVEAPQEHHRLCSPWDEHARGFDLGAARRVSLNSWGRGRFAPGQLLADPRTWAVLDYRTLTEPHAAGTLAWTAARAGQAHGLAAWFDAELAEGIGFTTAPDAPETIYAGAFFPWPQPVDLAAGDEITVDLRARLAGDEYVWAWNSRVRRAGTVTAEFRQSTFLAQPFSADALRRRAHDFRPVLGEAGRIDQAALALMDGGMTLGEVAQELRRRWPERFPSWEEALSRAGRLSTAYAE